MRLLGQCHGNKKTISSPGDTYHSHAIYLFNSLFLCYSTAGHWIPLLFGERVEYNTSTTETIKLFSNSSKVNFSFKILLEIYEQQTRNFVHTIIHGDKFDKS